MIRRDDIFASLLGCYATPPGHRQPVNIVDLGMVESVELTVDHEAPGAGIAGVPVKHRVSITLLRVVPDEDAQAILSMQIQNCLAGLQEVAQTSVQYAENPKWTLDRVSAVGRRLLQLDFPILNNRVHSI